MNKKLKNEIKRIIKEELLTEVKVQTKSGHIIELSPLGQKLKISMGKNYIELKGRREVQPFANALVKMFKIV